jgi:putative hydrolase of the HAD superfamily
VLTLALDVDGVLLDLDRGGAGHWTNELTARFAITHDELHRTLFQPAWEDVVNGRRAIESALGAALDAMGSSAMVEDVLSCWFEADFVLIKASIEFARRATSAGVRVVLATNQEHRRARFLRDRLGEVLTFEAMVYSGAIGVQKHDPQFFEIASKQLGIGFDRRADVVFVDDTIGNVHQARVAGWTAIHAGRDVSWISEVEMALGIGSS